MNFCDLLKKLFIPFFDEKIYQDSNPDIKQDFLKHYLTSGFDEARPGYFDFENSESALIPCLEIQYLRSKELPNIVILPEFFNGTPSPCSYIRLIFPFQYLEFLNELNIDSNAKLNKIWALNRRPFFANGFDNWLLSIGLRDRIFYDIDDDLIAHYGNHSKEAKLIVAMLLLSDVVTVSTKSLQGLLRKFNKNTKVRKNFALHAMTSKKSDFNDDFSILFMGTSTHEKDLEFIYEALSDVAKQYPKIRFNVIGIDELPNIKNIENIRITSSYYPQFAERYKTIPTFKLGLIPLVDNPINLSKSNIKYYDYLSKCENILCSDLGEYSNLKLPRLYPVKNVKSEWIKAIKKMIEQPRIAQKKLSESYNNAKKVKFDELSKLSKIVNSNHFENLYKFIDYSVVDDFLSESELYDIFLKKFTCGNGKILDGFSAQEVLSNKEFEEDINYLVVENLIFLEIALSGIVDNLIAQKRGFNLIIKIFDYDGLNSHSKHINSKSDSISLSNKKIRFFESKNYSFDRLISSLSSLLYRENLNYLRKIKAQKAHYSITSIKFQTFEAIFISL